MVTHPDMRRILRPLSLGLLWATLLASCKQEEGERCEVDDDCQGDLACDNPEGTGGRCAPRSSGPVREPDAGETPFLDAGGTPESAPSPDAGAPLDGPGTGGPGDAATDAPGGEGPATDANPGSSDASALDLTVDVPSSILDSGVTD